MRNKIADLNNHLFAQLERLGEEDLTDEQLAKEIDRSKAISNVAKQIIDGNRVMVQAMKEANQMGVDISQHSHDFFNKQLKE